MTALRLAWILLRSALMAAAAAGALAFAAVPMPLRAFTPGLFGLPQVAPNLHIDVPAEAPRVRAMIAAAEARTSAVFGPLRADPAWVVCTAQACADRLGLRPNGMTYAAHVIVIGPGGLSEMVFTHERVHAELHRSLSPRDLLGPRFPAWFDEGLAAHVSGDSRLFRPADPRAADWIRAAEDFFSWRRLREGRDWRDSYGAAATLVAEIEGRLGADGLRALIETVEAGTPFDAALAGAMGSDAPAGAMGSDAPAGAMGD